MARKDSKDSMGDRATARGSHWLSHSEGESTAAHDRSLRRSPSLDFVDFAAW